MRSSYVVFHRYAAKAPLGGALRPAAPAKACPRAAAPGCARGGLRERPRGPSGPSTGTAASFPSAGRSAHGPRIPEGCVQRPSRRKAVSVKSGKCIQKCGLAIVEKASPCGGSCGKAHRSLGKIRQRKPEIFGKLTKAFVKHNKKSNHFLPDVAFASLAGGRCGAGAGEHIFIFGSLILYHKNGF